MLIVMNKRQGVIGQVQNRGLCMHLWNEDHVLYCRSCGTIMWILLRVCNFPGYVLVYWNGSKIVVFAPSKIILYFREIATLTL